MNGHSPLRAWSGVLLLCLVGVINLVDRSLPGVLAEQIKSDLQLSDTTLGLINGFGFLVVYSLMGIPIARISDRGFYGLVISGCLAIWSAMTLIGSFATVGWQMALTRIGVAVGEAGNMPAAHAYIARNFQPHKRALPLAVLSLFIPFSSLLGFLGGGLLGSAFGWRTTFAVMGLAGLALAPLVLMLLGPKQELSTDDSQKMRPQSPGMALGLLRLPSFRMIIVATAFTGVGGYALIAFSASFFMRVHGLTLAETSVQFGIACGIAGIVGTMGTGILADHLSRRDARWNLWVLALLALVLSPLSFIALITEDAQSSVLLLAAGSLIGFSYLPPAIAALQRLAPPHMRATASALMLMFTALAGGIGPLMVGAISDSLQPLMGSRSLAMAMISIPVMQILAGLTYLAASIRFPHDIKSKFAPGIEDNCDREVN